jgi:hypothetical protein
MAENISETFVLIAEAVGRQYGTPIPKRLLTIGGKQGWEVQLNPTNEPLEGVDPFTAVVAWNEWPAGVVDPNGGVIAAGAVANLDTFLEWLKGTPCELN